VIAQTDQTARQHADHDAESARIDHLISAVEGDLIARSNQGCRVEPVSRR
jgi:hypothetical protein